MSPTPRTHAFTPVASSTDDDDDRLAKTSLEMTSPATTTPHPTTPTTTTTTTTTIKKRPPAPRAKRLIFLDGLRGLFALLVVYQHYIGDAGGFCHPTVTNRLGTHVGVPGFFTLSSYLLTYNLHHQMQKIVGGWRDLGSKERRGILGVCLVKYGIKRVLRIMPPFLVICVLGKHVLPALLAPGTAEFPPVSYFDLLTLRTAGLTVYWTIPVEMRYYLVIPIYVIAIHLSSWFLPIITLASFTFQAYEAPLDQPNLNIRVFFRTFLAGSVLGTLHYWTRRAMDQPDSVYPFSRTIVKVYLYCLERLGAWGRWTLRWGVDFTVLAMTLYSVSFLPPYAEKGWVWSGNWAGLYVVVLITLLMNAPESLIARGLESHVLLYFGKISFSAYLVHINVQRFYGHLVSRTPTVDHILVEFVIMTVLSHCMFWGLEKPTIDLAEFLCRRVQGWVDRGRGEAGRGKSGEALLPS
ncbi:hypothetical protein HDU67_002739 [Dinochytrium kinnereticum]|nr:hypothetical protein HDU67_002739 [Dinochytrium kinnereticum]